MGRRERVAARGERARATESKYVSFSISSLPSPPSPHTPFSAQLAKQQVLPAAQQISLEGKAEAFPFLLFPFFEMTCKCDTSHPEWASCFLHQFQR